jgi:hypothetical protein
MEDASSEFLSLQLEAANKLTNSDRLTELATDSNELARQVALNPSTLPELLQKLANSSDATSRLHVAANPNTPTKVLLNLGSEFPEALLDNPIFPLLLLENPNLVKEIPLTTLLSLLKCETVPVSFLEQAANKSDWQVRLAVAANPQTPKAALAKLGQSSDAQIAELVRLHVNWAGEMTSGWHEAAREEMQKTTTLVVIKDREYLRELAKIGLLTEWVIQHLLRLRGNSVIDIVLQGVASWVDNFPHILELLAKDNKWEIRLAVAKNPNTPASILEDLARDCYWEIRIAVSQNPSTPASILEDLARDWYWEIKMAVAQNPNTSARILEQLSRDDDAYEQGVAGNPNTPEKILQQLAQDTSCYVRSSVARNPNIPVRILEQLAQDNTWHVRWFIAGNPNTPIRILQQLAKDKNNIIRRKVVKHPKIAVSVLERLSRANNWQIRRAVAQNPNTPGRILEQLLADRVSSVRTVALASYLARNPKGLPVRLEQYAKEFTPSFSRFLVLLHRQIPSKALADNFRSPSWLERYAIAQHPKTPLDTLKTLAGDANRIVRAAAKANLQSRNQQP